MKKNHFFPIGLLMIALCILFVMSPALADPTYNSDLSASWKSGTALTSVENVPINTHKTLVFELDSKEGIGDNYVFTISLDELPPDVDPNGEVGFVFSGYTRASDYTNGEIIDVTINADLSELTYVISANKLSIEVAIQANPRKAYPNEYVQITGNFSRYVDEGSGRELKQIAPEVTATAMCTYPRMTSYNMFEFDDPALLPIGPDSVNLKFVYITDTPFNELRTAGMNLRYTQVTVDFSNITILANGVNDTYENWNDPLLHPISPIEIFDSNGNSLINNELIFDDGGPLIWRGVLPTFSLDLTNEFKTNGASTPHIDFKNALTNLTVQFNGRGPEITYVSNTTNNFNTADMFRHYTHQGTPFTAYSAHSTVVYLYPTTRDTSTLYLKPNSESLSSDDEKYQELFRAGIRTNVPGGADVEVTYEMPSGVTVTHLRIPPNGTFGTSTFTYGSIAVKDQHGYSQSYGNTGERVNLSMDGFSFGPGENITLVFGDVVNITTNVSSSTTYALHNAISFVGTTDSSVTNGNLLTFKAETNEAPAHSATLDLTVSSNYYQGGHIAPDSASPIITDSARHPLSSVARETPFYLYSNFSAHSSSPYSSIRLDPLTPVGLFSNPVLYFSVPAGVTINGVEATNSAGTITTLRDAYGGAIATEIRIFDDEGLYGSSGGKLVEVKLVNETSPGQTFWINTTNKLVRLNLSIPLDYSGSDELTFGPEAVLLSSWDPQTIEVRMTGSSGFHIPLSNNISSATLSSLSAAGSTGVNGIRAVYDIDRKLSLISTKSVLVKTSIVTPGGNLSYVPGDATTFSKLKAGSSNEAFSFYFSNTFDDPIGATDVYFILPKGNGWKPDLTGDLKIRTENLTGIYDVSYSVDTFTQEIGTFDFSDVSSTFTWIPMTFDASGDVNSIADNWDEVSAIKVSFTALNGGELLDLKLPFELPKVAPGSNPADLYGETARSQTMYQMGSELRDNTFTAAIELVQSDRPVIMMDGPGTDLVAAQGTQSIDYNDPIPDWWTVYTYDDSDDTIKLESVNITFTPNVGAVSHYNITSINSAWGTVYTPQISGGGSPDPAFVSGYKWVIGDTSFITNGVPGTYRIEYTTTDDYDLQSTVTARTIVLTKSPGTVVMDTPTREEFFWGASIPDSSANWPDYFKQFVTGMDEGSPIDRSRISSDSANNGFDNSTPNQYSMKYTYTDIGGNQFPVTVPVSVKYNGSLTGIISGNGLPVEGYTFTVNGNSVTTITDGEYQYALEATATAPTSVAYSLSFSSAPAGLKVPTTSPSGTGSTAVPNPTSNVALDPISMNATVTGYEGLKSVSLYQIPATPSDPDIFIKIYDSISADGGLEFERDVNSGWFDGTYYMSAELEPGYTMSGTSDFTVSGATNLTFQTTQFTVANSDIVKLCAVVKDTLISGSVWDDTNRDSFLDSGELGISGVTVSLINASTAAIIDTTVTDGDGSYFFTGLPVDSYRIGINIPTGYNRASEFINDQKINRSNSFMSDAIPLAAAQHVTDIDAGFYYQSGGGPGTGSANVVGPSQSGGTVVVDPIIEPEQTPKQDPIEEPPVIPADEKSIPWIWILLAILLLIAVVLVLLYRFGYLNSILNK